MNGELTEAAGYRSAAHPAICVLGDIPAQHAKTAPDQVAVKYGDASLTFRDLDTLSNQLANALLAEGFAPETRIAFLDRNSDAFFPILFGTSRAGLTLATVNFRLAPGEIAYILNDSETALLFVGKEFLLNVLSVRSELTKLKKIVVIDGNVNGEADLKTWLQEHSTSHPDIEVSPSCAAVQMYTSGTTGHPKGVELSQECMIRSAIEGLSVWPVMFRPGAAVLATMPLFHIAAANLCIAGLYAGARAEILRESTPQEIIQIIADHGISVVPLPAAIIHEITKLPNLSELDLSRLDTLLIAGSGIPVELLRNAQQALGCGFALSYGMTECCGGLTYLGPADCTYDAGNKLRSAGKPFGNNRLRIVDASGRDLGPGETGEILCKSDRLMTRYWRRADATAEAIRDGWYHSGDAGYLDEDGYLYVVDRIKDMVISGGENIYPVEIENQLIQHPCVDDVAVIGVPDPKWGESLLACIILKPGNTLRPDELEVFLRGRLAGYKIPRRYEFVKSFPRNATGKVLKRVMRSERTGQ
ncbi:long-chain-fatty-acid--CoA ligase [Hyphomonas sp.]|jgi:acyl-CoA synthetase (AMP-forming)/AMP-acid ligase II|uniref:long-chain-fatty-acid--CoA ligase n=1 Tax=Hyphomonas sp. TaxID=87 RepID=UPI0037C07C5A